MGLFDKVDYVYSSYSIDDFDQVFGEDNSIIRPDHETNSFTCKTKKEDIDQFKDLEKKEKRQERKGYAILLVIVFLISSFIFVSYKVPVIAMDVALGIDITIAVLCYKIYNRLNR